MLDIILKRRSVRTYLDEPISEEDLKWIENYIQIMDNSVGPFDHKIKLNTIVVKGQKNLGTYGIIKNPQLYIGGSCVNVDEALLDFGYIFEQVILDLTSRNIGTCWLAGTFKRHDFENYIKVDACELMPAVTPLGYFKKTRTLEQIMRKMAKSDNRKPFEELFFNVDQLTPISMDKNHKYYNAFLSVQNGPSASNKQPWRLVYDDMEDVIHFYLDSTPKYNTSLGFPVQKIDMGIAMKHFELAVEQKKNWLITEHPDTIWEYIISYK